MDDDYVAEVLAREARDSSQRYQKDGLGAYLPRRFVYILTPSPLFFEPPTDLTSPQTYWQRSQTQHQISATPDKRDR